MREPEFEVRTARGGEQLRRLRGVVLRERVRLQLHGRQRITGERRPDGPRQYARIEVKQRRPIEGDRDRPSDTRVAEGFDRADGGLVARREERQGQSAHPQPRPRELHAVLATDRAGTARLVWVDADIELLLQEEGVEVAVAGRPADAQFGDAHGIGRCRERIGAQHQRVAIGPRWEEPAAPQGRGDASVVTGPADRRVEAGEVLE